MDSPYQPGYWYFPHRTKDQYDSALLAAKEWLLDEGEEGGIAAGGFPRTAALIYRVETEALRKSMYRDRKRKRNSSGIFNSHGGHNRILSATQEVAIEQYCYDTWEAGLGATHNMVFAAIVWLKEVS